MCLHALHDVSGRCRIQCDGTSGVCTYRAQYGILPDNGLADALGIEDIALRDTQASVSVMHGFNSAHRRCNIVPIQQGTFYELATDASARAEDHDFHFSFLLRVTPRPARLA